MVKEEGYPKPAAMDIRSIIEPDASETAGAKPASRQRSDVKVPYPQPQSNFQSPYEAQASAYKGPRETRPPQPPPLLPPAYPTHSDLRSPSASSHNSSRSPYQQTPSSAISGGQYPFPQHQAQSLAHGFQPSEYAQRESHVSTPTSYQPYGPPTSLSQAPTVTTPISSHTFSSQTRHGSSRSLSTPTSAQSNLVKDSPKGSFDHTFDPIKAAYEPHPSQQYLSQQGTPLGPPPLTTRTTSILRRESPSASYEHHRNHSAGSYGHQQMISSSPTTDRPGSSAISALASGPRQSLSHAQNYHNKHEREKSLSVSPKTRLPGELNLRQSNEDSMLKSKDRANVSARMNSAKVEISEDRQGIHLSQEQSAIKSPSRSRSLGMKVILNSPSLNEKTSIVKQPTVQTKRLPIELSDNELKSTLANPIHSDRSESQPWHNFAVDSKQNNKNSPSDEKPPSQLFSPKRKSPAVSTSSKTQTQTEAKEFLKEQTSHDSLPPQLCSLLHTRNFSSVPTLVANSNASQSRAVPQSKSPPSDEKPPSQRFSPKWNSPAVSSKVQTQVQTKEYLKEPTTPDSVPHLSPLLQTRNFPSLPVPAANSSPSQSRAISHSPVKELASTASFPRQPSPAQTSRYSLSPAVPNSTPSQVTVKSPLREQSPLKEQPTQKTFSPHPSPLQAVGQSTLPAAPNPYQSQNTPKSPLKEQTPPSSFPPYSAAPLSATQSPLPTIGNSSLSQRAATPPLPQTTMSPAPSSQTVMSSGSTAAAEAVEQQIATKKIPDAAVPSVSSSSDRRRKRKRFEEIPIFARSCRSSWPPGSGNPSLINKDRSPVRKATQPRQSIQPTTRQVKQETNGHTVLINDVPLPNAHSMAPDSGLLGPWEDSITNTIPSDEYIRHLSDFLYKEVVGRLDVNVGPAGGGSTAGAVIEIEAKIGQLIDKNTNTRLRLPVTTECVINKDDPSLRVNFKSSMTEAQHRAMNEFLNKAFSESQNPKGRPVTPHTIPRIPMSYVHTHESDTFYELSQAGILSLPPSILQTINSRHSKAKVRITTDQKTGNTLAKIVKVRLADLDVYSPGTEFDYRISINLEKNLEGDWHGLVEPMARNVRRSDRNKDRVSYKHLAYQIDLTQVISPEAAQKEHELEVEISTAELRKHGILLKDGQPNEFQKLVEGFVNNIRILARGPNH